MKRRPQAYTDWLRIVTSKMPHLSKPQAVVLTMWSFGIAVTHCCGLSTVSVFLAELLDKKENTVRQQLREWYKQSSDKDGRKRAELDVSASFVPLLQWVLSWWPPQEKSLVLAADASTLGDRLNLLKKAWGGSPRKVRSKKERMSRRGHPGFLLLSGQ